MKGSVTNEGVVAAGLTVTGGYTQSAKGELVLRGRPLKVGGAVRLAGALDFVGGAGDVGGLRRTITVLDHRRAREDGGHVQRAEGGRRVKLARHDVPDQLPGRRRQ